MHERLTALSLAALLFAAMGGDAAGVHGCPHHDALPHGPHERESVAHGAAHHASSASEDRSGATHDGHGPCTCVGTCHASAAAPIPSASATHAVNARGPSVGRRFPERGDFRVVTLPYVLPYANAPPTAS